MKILIINPPIRLSDKPRHIPHGLAILANIVRRKLKITPNFIDVNAWRYSKNETCSQLKELMFDVVLIGGLIPTYKGIIELVDLLKGINKDCIVITGGSAAMSVPELILRNSKIDAVCVGEGEIAVVKLLEGLRNSRLEHLTDVRGFYLKIGDEIVFTGKRDLIQDLDSESDLPAYDLLPMEIYLSNPVLGFGRDIDFISSRGCPYECTFCYQPWGKRFRGHSADFVIDALKLLRKNYRVEFISFQDDEFMANRKRVLDFCDRIQGELPGILWSCTGRVNLVDDEIVGTMREAGCVSISYGFESGSPRIIKEMNKRATVQQMEKAVRINRKFGMMLPVSFIVGMPGEDDETCRETIDFCTRNQIPLKSIMFATPYPGTKLFDFAVSSGRIDQSKLHEFVMKLGDARDFTVNLTDAFTDEQLIAKRQEMIEGVCAKVKPISEEIYRGKVKKLFGRLADGYLNDKALIKHRAEHGGIDIF